MRKIITAALMCAMIFWCTNVLAAKAIDSDQAALGGIAIGSKIDYVRSIYGDPTKTRTRGDDSIEWYYGDSFQITFKNGRAVFVCSSANNGLNTPDDVGVGMKSRLVSKKYGRPIETIKFDDRSVKIYRGDDFQMMFVMRGKFISEIRLTRLDTDERVIL